MIENSLETTSQDATASCSVKGVRRSGMLRFVIQVAAIALLLGSALIGFVRWRTGSMGRVWPYLAGQRLLIEPTHLDVGAVEKASVLERELRVLNLGWKPFRLLGSQSSCGCISLDEFPIVVPAREGCTLKLEIGTSDTSGPFRHTIKFFSDTPGRISVVVPVTGIVL
jgi:hypothetical protein